MNSCVLMAEIVSEPQLRTTQDNLDVTEMIVRFDGLREEDPPATIKVLGWGNLASNIKNQYNQGDRVVIEGRLSMNTIEMQEGYKEKRAELVASRIFVLGDRLTPMSDSGQNTGYSPATVTSIANTSMNSPTPVQMERMSREKPSVLSSPSFQSSEKKTARESSFPETTATPADTSASPDNADWDEIPF
ncbi:MAG: single-stranded DNA-binding protein [Xenococcaceae cyanobacterium MO_188.B32]|nr:single-stranded DNA-binding protein [Xenococcaceae cyanobacterium MO_188.B32]